MKNINNDVFLNKINQRIKHGDFDTYLNFPFMSRDLLSASIKGRIEKRISSGGTPILNDNEIKDCIAETKETALSIILIYIKFGFIVKSEEGYVVTEKMQLAIRTAYRS